VPLLVIRNPKLRVGLRHNAPGGRLHKIQRQIVRIREGVQRVIQKVLRLCPNLQPHPLANLEIFEDPQVGVKVSWSVECRQHCWTVLANHRRCGEAVAIDILMRSRAALGVAGQPRIEVCLSSQVSTGC